MATALVNEKEDIAAYIAKQQMRGEFGYWSEADEIAWKEAAPPRPESLTVMQEIDLRSTPRGWKYRIGLSVVANHRAVMSSDYDTWGAQMEAGKSYLVGSEVPIEQFIKTHRSPLVRWMPKAFAWCKANPYYRLDISPPGRKWYVYAQGDFVVFKLPHHDYGGEKAWVSRDGKTRVLVNVD